MQLFVMKVDIYKMSGPKFERHILRRHHNLDDVRVELVDTIDDIHMPFDQDSPQHRAKEICGQSQSDDCQHIST